MRTLEVVRKLLWPAAARLMDRARVARPFDFSQDESGDQPKQFGPPRPLVDRALVPLMLAAILGLGAVAAGCGSAPQVTSPTPTATPRETPTPVPTATQPRTPTPDAMVQAAEEEAKADLAARLKIPLKDISVLKTEWVEWPDASLGCPEPDKMYAKIITPGHIVVLSVGGEIYEYHKPERNGEAILCAQKGGEAMSSVEIPAGAEEIIALAKAHLADRIGVSISEITVSKVEEVEWRNSSLGCPQPGMMYLQVITPGFRVILEAGGVEYEYHSDKGRHVIPCQAVKAKRPLSAAATPYAPKSPVDIARRDLAEKEGVAPEDIKVVSVEDVDWPDASLGCPQPGMMYAQVITPGKRIVLAIGESRYEYHTDMRKRAVLCPPGK